MASVLTGALLAGTAAFLARESKELLTGETILPAVQRNLRQLATETIDTHFGPADVLVALSLAFHDTLTAADLARAVCLLKRRIKQARPESPFENALR